MVAKGNLNGFYQSRLKRGDGFGKVGLEFGKDFSDQNGLTKLGSGRLALAVANKQIANGEVEGLSQEAAQQSLQTEIGEVRQELAEGYVNALDADQTGTPNKLSATDQRNLHVDVFSDHDLPATTFGGAPVTGTAIEAEISDRAVNWCEDCDRG